MKTKTMLAVVLAIGLTANQNAIAQPATHFGVPDCGSWVKSPAAHRKAWLLGFLSGLNVGAVWYGIEKDHLNKLETAEQAYVWMDNWCQRNPLDTVWTGGMELYVELLRKK